MDFTIVFHFNKQEKKREQLFLFLQCSDISCPWKAESGPANYNASYQSRGFAWFHYLIIRLSKSEFPIVSHILVHEPVIESPEKLVKSNDSGPTLVPLN